MPTAYWSAVYRVGSQPLRDAAAVALIRVSLPVAVRLVGASGKDARPIGAAAFVEDVLRMN